MLKNIFSIKNLADEKVITVFGIKIKISRFDINKIEEIKTSKPILAFQVNVMDKGGLEEVVLQLAKSCAIKEKYYPIIIAEKNDRGYLAQKARKEGIPVYSFFQNKENILKILEKLNIKIVHFHYNIEGAEIYKNKGVKTLYTIHNNYIWFDKEKAKERSAAYKLIDKFIAVSTQVREFFLEKFDVPLSKVEVIPNGIEYIKTSEIKPVSKESIGFKKDDFVFLNVASFGILKYQFAFIKALSQLKEKYPKIKVLIIGNVADKAYYKQVINFIKEQNVEDNVKILSYLPKKEVFENLKAADCFIMTSLSEGFSIAGLEAMLFNLPMVLVDIGGACDIILNNDIGIIVPHAFSNLQELNIDKIIEDNKNKIFHFDNVDKIILAMEDMYLNKEVWKKKAQLANTKIKECFNSDRVCADYLKEYNDILN